jgi:DNA adenine methylase
MSIPFLKWVGGKRQVLPELLPRLPTTFQRYFEPFVGGGALFFNLSERLLRDGVSAHVSDANEALIATYRMVKEQPSALHQKLLAHEAAHLIDDKTHYYTVRAQAPTDPLEVAARFIYLNRTCFNGIWRVNRRGLFNVPMGKYKNPGIANLDTLTQAHTALSHTSVSCQTYSAIQARKGDFVYFDPPYDPVSKTSSFVSYSKDGFGVAEQTALRDFVDQLTSDGVNVLLSNSNTPLIQSLYAHLRVETIQVGRSINATGTGRGKVGEVLIRNY